MAESLNNTGIVLDSTSLTSSTTIPSCSIAQSLPNQLVKFSASTPSVKQERTSKSMVENVENFCDPNWANNGFQHMEEIRRMALLTMEILYTNNVPT